VTGASRGIGRVIATQLAQRGVRVALHYRNNRAAAEESLRGLAGSGHAIFDADLSDLREASLLWQRVVDSVGAVDVLINNAGLYLIHSPLNTGYDNWLSAWQQTLATNLVAPANLSLLAAQSMTLRDPRNEAFRPRPHRQCVIARSI
jgi:3-oxoacyl-[acyl-carrier protein] reductase